MFTREVLLASDWYQERLAIKQQRDVALWERHVRSLGDFLSSPGHRDEARRLGIPGRLDQARTELERVRAPDYLKALLGTIGADPVHRRRGPAGTMAEAEASRLGAAVAPA